VNLTGQAIRQKRPPIRDPEYRRYVASQPCMACGQHESQAAAISDGDLAGGMKADGPLWIPLCPDRVGKTGCHTFFDREGQGAMAHEWWGLTIDELKAEARQRYEEWKA